MIYSQGHLKTITYGVLFGERGGGVERAKQDLVGGFIKYIHLTSQNVLFMKRIVQRKATNYFCCKTNKLEL